MRLFTSVKEALLLLEALRTFQRNRATAQEIEVIEQIIERIEKCLELQEA